MDIALLSCKPNPFFCFGYIFGNAIPVQVSNAK